MAHHFGRRYLKRSHEYHIDNNVDIYDNNSLLFIFMETYDKFWLMFVPKKRNESFLSSVVMNWGRG